MFKFFVLKLNSDDTEILFGKDFDTQNAFSDLDGNLDGQVIIKH